MFKKIELWVLFLIIYLFLISAIFFGYLVRDFHKNKNNTSLTSVADKIASIPEYLKEIFTLGSDSEIVNPHIGLRATDQRFKDKKSGFTFFYKKGDKPDLGYLLINRFDLDREKSVSELYDLNLQEKVYQWEFDVTDLYASLALKSEHFDFKRDAPTNRNLIMHSLLMKNGDLISRSQGGSPLLRNNPCSELEIFARDSIYHHSIESMIHDNKELLYVSKFIEPSVVYPNRKKFRDDAIAILDLDGNVLFEKSIVKIFEENDMGALIFGENYNKDPIHLNDVQPVMYDGKYWKKNDIFLSFRNQSMIMLYRPETNKVLWYQQGPWSYQHDVDILNDHTIQVFDNNASNRGKRGNSRVLTYNFETKKIQTPFSNIFENEKIYTGTRGRAENILNDKIFIEETNSGRMLLADRNGDILWEYYANEIDGYSYSGAWSRYINRDYGDIVKTKLGDVDCEISS